MDFKVTPGNSVSIEINPKACPFGRNWCTGCIFAKNSGCDLNNLMVNLLFIANKLNQIYLLLEEDKKKRKSKKTKKGKK
uniref:Uncharacterized protein n=1 Tax=Dictyoglomus turgidum TaxID=513050 RepID=A0A7C3SN83_9BACT